MRLNLRLALLLQEALGFLLLQVHPLKNKRKKMEKNIT